MKKYSQFISFTSGIIYGWAFVAHIYNIYREYHGEGIATDRLNRTQISPLIIRLLFRTQQCRYQFLFGSNIVALYVPVTQDVSILLIRCRLHLRRRATIRILIMAIRMLRIVISCVNKLIRSTTVFWLAPNRMPPHHTNHQ